MKKGILLTVAFLNLIVALSLASAFTAVLENPRMILYANYTKGLQIENSIIVNNTNSYDVPVEIIPLGVWKDIITFAENNITLEAGERKEIKYTVTIDSAGAYRSDILANFKDTQSKNSLSGAQDLTILVMDKTGKVPQNSGKTTNLSWIWIPAVILILIIVLLIVILARRRR